MLSGIARSASADAQHPVRHRNNVQAPLFRFAFQSRPRMGRLLPSLQDALAQASGPSAHASSAHASGASSAPPPTVIMPGRVSANPAGEDEGGDDHDYSDMPGLLPPTDDDDEDAHRPTTGALRGIGGTELELAVRSGRSGGKSFGIPILAHDLQLRVGLAVFCHVVSFFARYHFVALG